MVKQISDNEIHLLIKYIERVLWRVANSLSYIQDARCLKVNHQNKRQKSTENSEGQLLFSEKARDKGFSETIEHYG